MKIYRNSFHDGHLYLSIDQAEWGDLSSFFFEELAQEHDMPLQVMISSDSKEASAILNHAGFVLRRKCYEMNVGLSDLLSALPADTQHASVSQKGEFAFASCAEQLYRCYQDTHASVNPLTASFCGFFEMLPAKVFYTGAATEPSSAAFLEKNEIAYLYSRDPADFAVFAQSLLRYMFDQYDTITFEADDTDWAGMALKALFAAQSEPTFDTYVYLNRHDEHATLP